MSGFIGKIMKVDLSKRKVTIEKVKETFYRKWFGTYGFGSRILYKDIKPGIDPLGPDNVLGLTTGLMTGTPALFSGSFTAVTKSPLTSYWGDSRAGGFFGKELKFAGYDDIFFYGRASKPVYLSITNEHASLEEANDLWGLNVRETEKTLKENIGDERAQVASIGRSGEKLSLISSIMTDDGRAAGRSGVGAVMGSKNLKAVVIRGTKNIPIHDKDKLTQLNKKALDLAKENPMLGFFGTYGTTGMTSRSIMSGDASVKNWSGSGEVDFPHEDKFSAQNLHTYDYEKYSCFGCPVGCGALSEVTSGPYSCKTHRPEYETWAALGSMILNEDLDSIVYINYLLNDYGLDTISTGATIAFAIECYENGLITKEDTDNLELTWGNTDDIVRLVKKMSEREGFGSVLADGSKIASEKIGKESEKYAMHIGGQEIPQHDPRLETSEYNKRCQLMYIADATPARHTQTPGIGFTFQALGLCSFGQMLVSTENGPQLTDFINAITGWDVTTSELLMVSNRITTMRQSFNIREGWKPSDFTYPDRMLGKPPLSTGPIKNVTIDPIPKVREYWTSLGWDPMTGKPLKETLIELGLKELQKDLY